MLEAKNLIKTFRSGAGTVTAVTGVTVTVGDGDGEFDRVVAPEVRPRAAAPEQTNHLYRLFQHLAAHAA